MDVSIGTSFPYCGHLECAILRLDRAPSYFPPRETEMSATAEVVRDAADANPALNTARYARIINASKRARWDIDADVIRGRKFDTSQRFLPNGLSKVDDIKFLSESERRLLTQIQGRTYALLFGLVERFVNAKVLEVSR